MVSNKKPIMIDEICSDCINELKRGHRVEMEVQRIDQHGWIIIKCKHYPKL